MGDANAQDRWSPARKIRLRYIVGLTVIALLTIAGQGILQLMLSHQDGSAGVINLAGRQRMLSQRIAKCALAGREEQLRVAADEWRRTHRGLIAGDAELGLDGRNPGDIDAMLAELTPSFDTISGAVDDYLSAQTDAERRAACAVMLDTELDFLSRMNEIVFAYAEAQQARVTTFKYIERALGLATLLVLALEVALIFEPAVRTLARSWRRMEEGERRYALAVGGSRDAIWDWDLKRDRLRLADRFAHMVGAAPGALTDSPNELISRIGSHDLPAFNAAMGEIAQGHTDRLDVEVLIRHNDGSDRWVLCRAAAQRDADGTPVRLAGSLADITELKRAQERLRELAERDELTGLMNRKRFTDQLDLMLSRRGQGAGSCFGVLFLDFDRFKTINDSLGHHVGDALLVSIARRLENALAPGTLCARFGGDEFAVLLQGASVEVLEAAAHELLDILALPHTLGAHSIISNASLGLVAGEERYRTAAEMIRDADTAMYEAKSNGRGRVAVFDRCMHEDAVRRQRLENELQSEDVLSQLRLEFEPQIALANARVDGFEALVRWDRPDAEPCSPAEFIPIAEECNAIHRIGDWIFDQATVELERMGAELGRDDLTMSINISRKQLLCEQTIERMIAFAHERPELAKRICLEVTETAFMDARVSVIPRLQALRNAGFMLAMDDFGTGYSSLSCLHQFPITTLKIDRAFVTNMQARREFAAVCFAIVTLAQNLGLRVVSEGVEHESQLAQLQSMDCGYAQGYLFSRPLTPERAIAFARAGLDPDALGKGDRRAA